MSDFTTLSELERRHIIETVELVKAELGGIEDYAGEIVADCLRNDLDEILRMLGADAEEEANDDE